MSIRWAAAACAVLAASGLSLHAAAEELQESPNAGLWRVEIGAVAGGFSGESNRDGDFYFAGSIEYGWPVFSRAVLGLKAYPLFLYHEEEGEDGGSEEILGAGAGLFARLYARKDETAGIYAEASIAPIYHSDYLEDNSSRMNFLNSIGVGYEFDNDWHVSLKWEHMSNANLGSDNAGMNGLSLGAGFSF
jgi:hypothetical protein